MRVVSLSMSAPHRPFLEEEEDDQQMVDLMYVSVLVDIDGFVSNAGDLYVILVTVSGLKLLDEAHRLFRNIRVVDNLSPRLASELVHKWVEVSDDPDWRVRMVNLLQFFDYEGDEYVGALL